MRRWLATCLATVAAMSVCAHTAAAPFAVRLGGERLVLDTPPGFSDAAAFSSPRLNDLAESLTEASNRVLLFALADSDARRFGSGDELALRRYLVVVTPRATERHSLTDAQFAALLKDSVRDLGEPLPESADYTKHLIDKPPGQAQLLALLHNDAQTLSILRGIRRPPQGGWREKPMLNLSTVTLVLIGGRALYISAFSAYDGPADLAWIRTVSDRWVEELRRLNR